MKKTIKVLVLILLISGILSAININIKVPDIGIENDTLGAGTVNRTDDAYIISGAGHNKTVTLNGERVEINGASNTLKIKGKVSSIEIRGAGNTVYVDSVERVTISGASSSVLYKTSPTKSGKPSSTIRGAGSYVKKQ